jgi:hypothetical protein
MGRCTCAMLLMLVVAWGAERVAGQHSSSSQTNKPELSIPDPKALGKKVPEKPTPGKPVTPEKPPTPPPVPPTPKPPDPCGPTNSCPKGDREMFVLDESLFNPAVEIINPISKDALSPLSKDGAGTTLSGCVSTLGDGFALKTERGLPPNDSPSVTLQTRPGESLAAMAGKQVEMTGRFVQNEALRRLGVTSRVFAVESVKLATGTCASQ